MIRPLYIWIVVTAGFFSCNVPSGKQFETQSGFEKPAAKIHGNGVRLHPIIEDAEEYSNTGIEIGDEIKHSELKDILTWLRPAGGKVQTIFVKSGCWQTIKGSLGTEITLNTRDFEGSETASGYFRIILIEMMDKISMLKNGVQTTCNGRPLETLGALYIALSDGKRSFQLKQGKSIMVRFPKTADFGTGVFYSTIDRMGCMNSASARRLLSTTEVVRGGGFNFNKSVTGIADWQTLHLLRLKNPALMWERTQIGFNGHWETDTLNYQKFAEHVFKFMEIQTRSYLIPIEERMVPIENIDAIKVDYTQGDVSAKLWMHYLLNKPEEGVITEKKNLPAEINQTGWIQFSKYFNFQKYGEVKYECTDEENVKAGLIYLIYDHSNTIYMQPWIPESGCLPSGNFNMVHYGQNVTILAVIKKDSGIYFGFANAKGGQEKTLSIHFQPVSGEFSLDQFLMLP